MSTPLFLLFLFFLLISNPTTLHASHLHQINIKSPNLYPQSLAYDPSAQHFLITSLALPSSVSSVSDAALLDPLLHDPSLPPNASFSSLALDPLKRRLLLTLLHPSPSLAAYDLKSHRRLFLTPLPDTDHTPHRPVPQNIAVDFKGNAFVTNSAGNFIWKVDEAGNASVFSRSPQFTKYDSVDGLVGLSGIVYVSKGYLLVVQANTGKVFKVSEESGRANLVLLNEDLVGGSDMAVRRDGVVFVVSPGKDKIWVLKSQDSWAQGVVYDSIEVVSDRFPTAVAVGERDRVYVLYGHVEEGMEGKLGRERFCIQEVRSKKEEEEDDHVWVFLLVGLGLAYFMFWRFQMRQLVTKMDKKIN